MPWTLTVRAGSRVERDGFGELEEALGALESRARELAAGTPRRSVDTKVRRYEPAQQVSARLEVAGPQRMLASVHAGVDVRGDGSVQAFVGRVRRRLVEPLKGESPYAALGRVLESSDSRMAGSGNGAQ